MKNTKLEHVDPKLRKAWGENMSGIMHNKGVLTLKTLDADKPLVRKMGRVLPRGRRGVMRGSR